MSSTRSKEGYQALNRSESDLEEQVAWGTKDPGRRYLRSCLRYLILLLCLAAAFVTGMHANYSLKGAQLTHKASTFTSDSCRNATIRREWRSLSREEKTEYLRAVKCLTALESQVGVKQSIFDDFAWVHSRFGESSHGTAFFLSWHRYFLHIFEETLHEECAFQDHLPYWDWSLDWEDLTRAPVWDPVPGFGGDGNTSDVESVSFGHCVTDGPFARLELMNYGQERKPHCLSRGFLDDKDELRSHGDSVSPRALEELLTKENYAAFNLGLEFGAHNAIPFSMRGDFFKFTAPNDPVFYLHHTQLDRIWWKWQHRSLNRRGSYSGDAGENITASVDDFVNVGPLAPAVKVADIMSTESGVLCYQY